MYKTYTINVRTRNEDDMINVSRDVVELVDKSGITNGEVVLFVPHTTAAVTINENADPDVKTDMLLGLRRTFPKDKDYAHYEGNSHAHIKSSVVGVSETILLENGQLVLGTWQGIYFMEFDGPRNRKLVIQVRGE